MTPGTAIADYLNGIRYHRYSRSVPIERRRLLGLAAVCGETAWLADRRVAVVRSFRGEASIYYHAREDGTIAATEAQELAAAVDRFSVDLEPLAPLLALNQRCATAEREGRPLVGPELPAFCAGDPRFWSDDCIRMEPSGDTPAPSPSTRRP